MSTMSASTSPYLSPNMNFNFKGKRSIHNDIEVGLLTHTPHADKIAEGKLKIVYDNVGVCALINLILIKIFTKVAESPDGEWFATVEGTAVGLWKVSNSSNMEPKLILWRAFPIDFPDLESNENITLAVSNSRLVAVSYFSLSSPNKKSRRDLFIINKKNNTKHHTLIINFSNDKRNKDKIEKIGSEQQELTKGFSPDNFDENTRGFVRFLSGGDRLAILDDKNLKVFNTLNWEKIYEIDIPFKRTLKELELNAQSYVLEKSIESDFLIWTENSNLVHIINLNDAKTFQEIEIQYSPETQYAHALSKNNNHLALVGTNDMVMVYALDTKTKLFERNFKNDIGDDPQSTAFVSFVEYENLNDNLSVILDIERDADNINENKKNLKLLICGRNESNGNVWMLVYDVLKNEMVNRVQRVLSPWPARFNGTNGLFFHEIINFASTQHDGTNPSTPLTPLFFSHLQIKTHEYLNIDDEFYEKKILHHTKDIQHVKISHNGQYVGTYSEGDGILCIWKIVDGQSLEWLYSWEICRPKDVYFIRNQNHAKHVCLSVSNNGHIALSFFVMSQTEDNFSIEDPFKLKNENYEARCLVLRANQNKPIQHENFKIITGVVSFLPNTDLVIYDNNSLSYYTVHVDHCKLKHKLDLKDVTKNVRSYYETTVVESMVIQSMLQNDLLIAEESPGILTAFDVKTGHIKMKFTSEKIPEKYTDDLFTTFAVSSDSKLLGVVDRAGILQIYLMENGLKLKLPMISNIDTFAKIHGFLDNTRIVVESGGGHIWIMDVYNGQFLRKLPLSRQKFAFRDVLGGLFAKCKKNKVKIYNFGEKECNYKTSLIGYRPYSDIYMNEYIMWNSVRGIFEFQKGENKFNINVEPWNEEDGLSVFFLNNAERVVIIGKHTIQLYNTENKQLLFLWICDPDDEIIKIEHCHYEDENDENIISDYIIVTTENENYKIKIRLPNHDETHDYETMLHFCKFLAKYTSNSRQIPFNVTENTMKLWVSWLKETLKLVKEEIKKKIKDFDYFNHIHLNESPVSNLVVAGCDDLVEIILENKKYIPRFYYDEINGTKKSSLSLAIEYRQTHLIELLIKYYIDNATKEPGWMQTIIPTLPTLCVEYPDFVQMMVNKLMFIPNTFPLDNKNSITYEFNSIVRSSNENLYSFTLNENLKKEIYGISYFLLKFTTLLGYPFVLIDNFWRMYYQRNYHPVQLCVIPLPGLNEYEFDSGIKGFYNRWIKPRTSVFAQIAFQNNQGFYTGQMMQVILNQKWNSFGRRYFIFSFMLHILYYCLFAIGLEANQKWIYILVSVLAIFFLTRELWQFSGYPLDYLKGFYNWIDVGVYSLPLITSFLFLQHGNVSDSLKAFSILLIWTHFVIQLRIFENLGIFINILIEIGIKIFWFMIVFSIIIWAFSHAFVTYLSAKSIEPSTYIGTFTSKQTNEILTLQADSVADNVWKRYDSATLSVIWFLAGDWSAIDSWSDDPVVKIFKLLFFFLSSIILLNVLIALMGDTFVKAKEDGKRAWLQLRAEFIAEIECYNMTPQTRSELTRGLIFYEADPDDVGDWKREIEAKSKTTFESNGSGGNGISIVELDQLQHHNIIKLLDVSKTEEVIGVI
ncbi:7056_t:CDS:10 [Diversispora eburnea]|uniref:7056_t:CDS:1 n=1 Tax=Diversispora eburnea TaxID=1213867 RepID=A0A9N8V293_9GLOM|nr:7056_t:CDS:10 [Diversispora eburnea]